MKYTHDQIEEIRELLWESLPDAKHNPYWRQTGWGNKSLSGLIAALEAINNPYIPLHERNPIP